MRIRLDLVVLCLLLVAPPAAGADAPLRRLPPLLTATVREGTVKVAPDVTVVRSENVVVNFQSLDSGSSKTVIFPIFDGASLTLIRDRLEGKKSTPYVWVGHVDKDKGSSATLSVRDSILIANVTTAGKQYEVRYQGNGVHALLEIDQSKFPVESKPLYRRLSAVEPEGLKVPKHMACKDPATDITVMVLYTADTRAAAGGTPAMLATIDLVVSETNQSYLNSDIAQRIRLVATHEVTYTESGLVDTDLENLRNPSSGLSSPSVLTLRNASAADAVVLMVEDGGCGVSYQMDIVSHAFESNAYAVVTLNCAMGARTFGHELGHVMGARHDWGADTINDQPYVFNHGYINMAPNSPATPWRTMMATTDDCVASGVTCPRLLYWSNPAMNNPNGGDPLGVGSGSQQSDNHRTLNNTAATVANFRCSPRSVRKGPPNKKR